MEAIAEGLFSIVKWLVVQVLFEWVFYWTGRLTLLLLTLGQYPRGSRVGKSDDECMFVGLVVFIIAFVALTYGLA